MGYIKELEMQNNSSGNEDIKPSLQRSEMETHSTSSADPTPERWVFTFGFGHTHPATGERLANCYVVIEGDIDETREIMQRHFGNAWAFQYPTEQEAGVERWDLRRIDLHSGAAQ